MSAAVPYASWCLLHETVEAEPITVEWWHWAVFGAIVFVALALDLGVFHRKSHVVSFKEAVGWTFAWVTLAMAFCAGIFGVFGPGPALEFMTGYVIEQALSVDNLFVFLVVFSYFSVPSEYQHRVLFWGILGALIMRGIFVAVGAAFLETFHWGIYVFGGILIVTGAKLLFQKGGEVHPEKNFILRLFRKVVPMVNDYRGNRFTVKENGRRLATPLLLVLVVVEGTDVVFAVDSVPAIFAVTRDPFIVYTSNIFAILGLRSLFFLLAGIMDKFHYLKVGLALVLLFVGGKMLLESSIVEYIPKQDMTWLSLVIVAGLLSLSVVASLLRPKKAAAEDLPFHPAHDGLPGVQGGTASATQPEAAPGGGTSAQS